MKQDRNTRRALALSRKIERQERHERLMREHRENREQADRRAFAAIELADLGIKVIR